jgi:hypothetical protein
MKAGGNNGASRGHNNQPLTGAAKAGGGCQQEQEDNGWRLAMKKDGCHPVMTHHDDVAPPAGRRGTQRQTLFCHCHQRGAGAAMRGGCKAIAKREHEGHKNNDDDAIAKDRGRAVQREATINQRTRGARQEAQDKRQQQYERHRCNNQPEDVCVLVTG